MGVRGSVGWGLLLLATSISTVSCGRVGYDGLHDNVHVVTDFSDRHAGTDTLASADELPAGAVGLSLREALTIAGNTPGTDWVTFAPSAGPRTITTASPLPDVSGAGTAVDGGGAVTVDCSPIPAAEPALRVTADDTLVTGLRFVGCGGDAIEVSGGTTGVRIEDVTMLDIGGRGVVAEECTGLTIHGLHIERAGGDLVAVTDCTDVTVDDGFMVIGNKDSLRGVHFIRVTESRIVDNIIDPGDARLVDLDDCHDIMVARNILDRGDAGVVIEGPSTNISVIQNVIIGSVYDGVYVGGGATNTRVLHNTMLNCSSALVDSAADTSAQNNLVSTDPTEFVAPAPPTYDFTLAPGSAHVDVGEPTGIDCLPDDPADYYGLGPDLGAVESY